MTPRIPARIREEENITVTINGTQYQVPTTFSETSLADYLRVHLQLTGTKIMCREGGCGACTVLATFPDPGGATGQVVQKSINACLCPILSCDGWEITTIEALGTKLKPHPLQTSLTEHYGSQCGYCTPGMIMRMYSLLQNNSEGTLTKQMVEDGFGGNICRCTGYRPILEAFKTFAKDGQKCDTVADVEDLGTKLCKTTGQRCSGACHTNRVDFVRQLPNAVGDHAPHWYKPINLDELYPLVEQFKDKKPYYVVGHTGVGVYNDAPYDAYIDMKHIEELYAVTRTPTLLSIGANLPLTDVIDLFYAESREPGFAYLKPAADNIARTAHPSLRNAGSWGGNLAMKNLHKEFPSDSFISFIISDAKIITGPDGKAYSMEDFVKLEMKGKVILRAEFPIFAKDYIFRAYKIMPRNSNAHALVNAGFRAKISGGKSGSHIIAERPVIVFGNITEQFIHATDTENFLVGKDIGDVKVLQQALSKLSAEIDPDEIPAEATPAYKKSLSLSLFYKFALEIVGSSAADRYRSAIGYLERAISSGTQSFPTKKELWPLTQPMPKIESLAQCTGEAKYISDIEQDGMLFAAFTLTTKGNATIYSVDSTKAMALPGVIRVFTYKDIPGINNINQIGLPAEEFLAEKEVKYAGQPVAFVVAITRDLAEQGAKLVDIKYMKVRDAIVTCEDAIKNKSFFPLGKGVVIGDAEAAINNAPNKISGEVELGSQSHFHMETQVCVSYPLEDGLDVEAGTQWIDMTQVAVANCVGIGKNRVNISVKRNGGGFGGKATRNFLAAATAIAAHIMRRPVKMHMSLWDNMKMMGKRFAYHTKYQAGFDNDGKLTGLILDIYRNTGAFSNLYTEMNMEIILEFQENGYKSPAWKIVLNSCKTHTPGHTWCRAPGSTEAIFFFETVMEHMATVLKKPAIDVKAVNFLENGDTMVDGSKITNCTIDTLTQSLLDSSSYRDRVKMVDQFNEANRWRKRGVAVVPMRYPAEWNLLSYSCTVVVFHNGGTVAVTHAGIELGQGINTKVAQVVAHELGIDFSLVAIQPTTSINNANTFPTANSTTSEMCCLAAISCCEQIRNRMAPVKAGMKDAPWPSLVEACYMKAIDMSARGWAAPRGPESVVYNTYAAMCTEVELDVLTGEYQINRCDVLYDCGDSMSPLIDVGQVEGAVIMGFGYFTSEEIIYDKLSAEMLTIGTWKYKPPTAKDIPIDFRIALLQNAPNPSGVLRSKIVGEPPLCMACSVVFALRNAAAASRIEKTKQDTWFRIDGPVTVEKIQQLCATDVSQLRYSD